MSGRFCARFDAIYTIESPSKPSDLSRFLRERRIGSLNAEFVRDLHVRMFLAFASLGFSDYGWLSAEDLKWLAAVGRLELAKAEGDLQNAEAEKMRREAEGKQYAIQQMENAQKKGRFGEGADTAVPR